MIGTINKGLRIEKVLLSKTEAAAAKCHLHWSEWVRQVLRKEVGLLNGKYK